MSSQPTDVPTDESISQIMIEDEWEEKQDVNTNSESPAREATHVSHCNLPSLVAYFIVNSENVEEGRAFLKV